MNSEGIYKTIRDFLFSNVNKQFLIFLFFLLLSGIFWLMMTLNETYEREIKVPVQVVGIPKHVVLTSPATDTMRVTMRDKGWMLMGYLYGNRLKTVVINFKTYDRGNGTGLVSSSEIKRQIEQQVESSTKVSAIKPEKLEFYYNNGEYKRVPIRWTGRIIPDQVYYISDVIYTPDSVDIYASQEKLDSIRAVFTEPLNYVGFRDTLTVQCALSHPSDVKVVPERISISFLTDVLTEESIAVPIHCLNVPEGKVLRTFPAKGRVMFVSGASIIKQLKADDFSVVADYKEIMANPSDKCNIYLRHTPPGISRPTLETTEIDYLIEDE